MVEGFWAIVLATWFAYHALFLWSSRPVGWRLWRIGWAGLVIAAGRGLLVLCGAPLKTLYDLGLGAVFLSLSIRIWVDRDGLIVRATGKQLRKQIHAACAGLRLQCEEPHRGLFRLTDKGMNHRLLVDERAATIQGILLPRPAGSRKVTLLVEWLLKQYPGPIPRFKVVLKRSAS